jgi:cytoskeletal protein RodZ
VADNGNLTFPAIVAAVVIFAIAPVHGGHHSEDSSTSSTSSSSDSTSSGDSSDSEEPTAKPTSKSPTHTTPPRATSAPPTGHRPSTVEGVNPETTDCADSALTVQGKNAQQAGKVYARVELRYSPLCRASWVRTLGSAGEQGQPTATWGRVVRTSDGVSRPTEHCSDTFCWSDMVDVAGMKAYAEGGFDYGSVDLTVKTKSF